MIEKGESEVPTLTVKSAVKRYLADVHNVRVGSDFFVALDEKILDILKHAVEQCRGSGRVTVRKADI